jgi:thioester reductase-like protein
MSFLDNKIANKKFFITGATGYLGSHLVNRLLGYKVEVNCFKRKESDISRLKGGGADKLD